MAVNDKANNRVGNSNSKFFESFYKFYKRNQIELLYSSLKKDVKFNDKQINPECKAEIRYSKGIFGIRFESIKPLSINSMIIIGYYLDNYNAEYNYVWTDDVNRIKKFIKEALIELKERNVSFIINLEDQYAKELIEVMCYKTRISKEVREILTEDIKELENKSWDEFVTYGKTKYDDFLEDKRINEVISMDLPMDWDNIFASDECAQGVHIDNPSDALVYSLANLGKVDIEYISQITGYSYKDVIYALRGAIYQNPEKWEECFYKGWETSDEYLSGNVLQKLKLVKELNVKYKGYFERNVKALEKISPTVLGTDNIYITLGSPWVPSEVIDDFIEHLLGTWIFEARFSNQSPELIERMNKIKNANKIKHDIYTGTWAIPYKYYYSRNVANEVTYGTKRMVATEIIERTLNVKTISITDEVSCPTNKSGVKRVINKEETLLVLEKQKKIIEEFQSWVWKDPDRKKMLLDIYESKFGSYVIRTYNGNFLNLNNINPEVNLYDHQKDAIARILLSGNTLLSHDVGAGKTYVMIAAGMELKRIGISKKNMYVVPNNLVGQWELMFKYLYPDANLLCINPNRFKLSKRDEVLKKIKNEDFDAIIIAYSSFDMIEISKQFKIDELKKLVEEYSKAYKKNRIEAIAKKRDKALKELEKLEKITGDEKLFFDDLGINTLFVDEAHNYKNLPIETGITRVLGLSTTGSVKCSNMLKKVRHVQKANNGRGVVFATGTPITNSLTDIFVMQKYLQNGELELLDLNSFDSWIAMFAEQESNFEIDVDTNSYRMATRFSKFHNMPELANILTLVTDFHQVDQSDGIPEKDGYSDVKIAKTKEFEAYLKEISTRADNVRHSRVKRKDDNMLKITTDGRKAALDLRLVGVDYRNINDSKVAKCAQNIYDIYIRTKNEDLTQLVFCDSSTPKKEFNLYDELKRLLVVKGIPSHEIAFVHDAVSESKRTELFEQVQKGLVRVLIGSTFKLGLGVNVQNKLYALHHLDVPWRPSDMIQREGRIMRKGNENDKVEIYRYITDGSFDAYSWQLLETKQKMICSILSGCVTERYCEEIDGVALDYAEVKALAIGNQLLKERFEKANELSKYVTLQRKLIRTREMLEIELLELPNKINLINEEIIKCQNDIDYLEMNRREYSKEERKELRELIHNEVYNNDPLINEKIICKYHGFDLIVPTNLSVDKPYLYIQRNGKYSIDLGQTILGDLVRIDNFFNDFEKYLKKLEEELSKLNKRQEDVKTELSKKESYIDIINELKKDVETLDAKLGVN